VDIRYRQTYDYCSHYEWTCRSGNCGSQDGFEYNDLERGDMWCQTDALMTRNLQSNRPFEMQRAGMYDYYYYEPWQLLTHVDLGTRSDTGIPNSSPVTAILPLIR
ncbi:hypothetical protein GJAV_G00228650, partial [Gymnothorax javanicus]